MECGSLLPFSLFGVRQLAAVVPPFLECGSLLPLFSSELARASETLHGTGSKLPGSTAAASCRTPYRSYAVRAHNNGVNRSLRSTLSLLPCALVLAGCGGSLSSGTATMRAFNATPLASIDVSADTGVIATGLANGTRSSAALLQATTQTVLYRETGMTDTVGAATVTLDQAITSSCLAARGRQSPTRPRSSGSLTASLRPPVSTPFGSSRRARGCPPRSTSMSPIPRGLNLTTLTATGIGFRRTRPL